MKKKNFNATYESEEFHKKEICANPKCGHVKGSHSYKSTRKDLSYYYCRIKGCACKKFEAQEDLK